METSEWPISGRNIGISGYKKGDRLDYRSDYHTITNLYIQLGYMYFAHHN
ncbi:MAG: hypothetical protein AAFW89_05505 [Bacteroidota bacterium]